MNIAILGGGSAGWLTALFIEKVWPGCRITVIEDPTTPPIIAGESGSASLNKLYNFLEIDFDEWVKAVNAMPKLGGRFVNWNSIGTEFTHGLVPSWYNLSYNAEFPEYGTANDFLACALATSTPLDKIFYNATLQKIGKLPISQGANGSLFNVITLPMWHFDSRANAAYLKDLSISKGIVLTEGKYLHSTRKDTGDLTSITLDNNTVVEFDWIFDCSGFARLLLGKELQEPFTDFSNYFPARAVLAWWEEQESLNNYTKLTAQKHGWSWEINLNHRVGNGYIYDPDHISVDQAKEEIELQLGKEIKPVANLKFTPGIYKNCWKNNVIAIGLSSGFLEPLESNGLAAVAEQLKLLSNYWSPLSTSLKEKEVFNTQYLKIMTDISDFLSLHYRGHRQDTEFWKSHKFDKFRISNSLQIKLDLWDQGFIGVDDTEVYALENYAVVMQGLDLINKEKLSNRLIAKRHSILSDFNHHYRRLSIEIENISKICYTVNDWKKIIYAKP